MSVRNYFIQILIVSSICFSNEKHTINGYVRDAETGEELIHATVAVVSTQFGITTNEYGFYSLTLPEGMYTIRYSYLGYVSEEMQITLDTTVRKDVNLRPSSVQLGEMIITGSCFSVMRTGAFTSLNFRS